MLEVNTPMVVPNKVVDVPVIVVGVVNAASPAFSQRTTLPVFPLKVKLDGVLPEHIVWFDETVPPTEVGSTLNVTFCVKSPLQFGVVLVIVTPVICNICPLLAAVKTAEAKLALPPPLAKTFATGVCNAPSIV